MTLLIFFSVVFATIVFAIILERIIHCPILVGFAFFAAFLIVAAVFDSVILVIAAIVQLIEVFLKKFIKPIYNALGIYLPLITTNCAVLGITMLNITNELNFIKSIINALSAGIGFMLAMLLFSGVRSKVETADVPEFLKGLPITLVSAALVALSFLGFAGIGG